MKHPITLTLLAACAGMMIEATHATPRVEVDAHAYTLFVKRSQFDRKIAANEKIQTSLEVKFPGVQFAPNAHTPVGPLCSVWNPLPVKVSGDDRRWFHSIEKKGTQISLAFQGKAENAGFIYLKCEMFDFEHLSLGEFENQTSSEFRSYAPKADRKVAALSKDSPKISDLKFFRLNGVFGSGFPKTHGIQLKIGAHLEAFPSAQAATLFRGKKCKLLSQNLPTLGKSYEKHHFYALSHVGADPSDSAKTRLVFSNWNHSPHQIQILCDGHYSSVSHMTLSELEADLNHVIRVYSK